MIHVEAITGRVYPQGKTLTVYDLGEVTPTSEGIFTLTAEQKNAIVKLWNRGYCVLKLTVDNKDYHVFKERMVTFNDATYYAFVGYDAEIALDLLPYTKTIFLGISFDSNSGLFATMNNFSEESLANYSVNGHMLTTSPTLTFEDLLACPDTAGEYTLKATVDDTHHMTFTWVKED